MPIQGGCLCRQVRYEIDAEAPIVARVCWRHVCQYLGAGSGTANAVFPKAAIKITGKLEVFTLVADSGAVMHRRFCPKCGTPVFSEAEPRPHHIVVRVGTLDDPEIGKPVTTIWAAMAPSWACIDAGLSRSEGSGATPK